ncbi:hypothetical protein GQ43DRAFT_463500 [Delitschia confertaspora ATCC 74209]|uniref:Uncharacterized protein n=1 Tax=Delitschia confertaspora ATCC 74209 TaxID=1513339 RepID=A0A9P4JKG9_9PLEO|nr:hypothetical protein GQ43DRAFT_463500 [Delitschia confertaspora ATCC 74209]
MDLSNIFGRKNKKKIEQLSQHKKKWERNKAAHRSSRRHLSSSRSDVGQAYAQSEGIEGHHGRHHEGTSQYYEGRELNTSTMRPSLSHPVYAPPLQLTHSVYNPSSHSQYQPADVSRRPAENQHQFHHPDTTAPSELADTSRRPVLELPGDKPVPNRLVQGSKSEGRNTLSKIFSRRNNAEKTENFQKTNQQENSQSDDLMSRLDEMIGQLTAFGQTADADSTYSTCSRSSASTEDILSANTDHNILPIQRPTTSEREPRNPSNNTDVESSCADQTGSSTTLEAKLTLSNILNHLLDAAQDFQELRPSISNNVEAAVIQCLEKYKYLKKGLEPIQQKIAKTAGMRKEITNATVLLEECKKKLTAYEYESICKSEEMRRLKEANQQASQQWHTQEERHKQATEALTNTLNERWDQRVRNLHSTIQLNETRKVEEITRLSNKFEKERQEWKNKYSYLEERSKEERRSHSNTIVALKSNFALEQTNWNQELQSIKEKHRQEIKALETGFEPERRRWRESLQIAKRDYESQLVEETKRHDTETEALHEEIVSLKSLVEKERDEVEQRIRRNEEEVKKACEARIMDLRANNEKLMRALVDRDHVKGLTDPQLASRFEDLKILLEGFSRNVQWDSAKERDWPFSETRLQKFQGKTATRRLKQQIVQSYLWAILYDHIFITPYQVFGEEGKLLLAEWTDTFGRDQFSTAAPDWPEPTEASEKARSETIKRCLEQIQQESGSNVKRCSDQTLSTVTDQVLNAVKRVTTTGPKEVEDLRKLVNTAAKLWLEVCSQRYRILVVLPNSTGNIFDREQKRDNRALKVIVKPELRRIGNSQGQELSKQEAIGKWKGEEVVYEIR